MIIVDSDVLIEIFDKNSKKGRIALEKLEKSGDDIAITSLNLHEILYGHFKLNKKVKGIVEINVIEFNKKDAQLSAKIELDLEKKGKIIPRFDAMIAAIAINRNAKIFTFNKKHFQNIRQIKLFD
jgi:predicted nucleic acid-binding protein